MENDRVFGDLWGKSNVPVVLNNPYSEAEQVSTHLLCFGWGWVVEQGPFWQALTPWMAFRDCLGCPEDPWS